MDQVLPMLKKFLRYLCLFLAILLYSDTATPQTSAYTDSVKKVVAGQAADTNKLSNLIALSNSYLQYNPDSSLAYSQQSLALAERLHHDMGIYGSESLLIQSLITSGNFPLALEHCFRLFSLSKKINDPGAIAYAKLMFSDCYYNLGDYDTSLAYLQEVITLAKKECPAGVYHFWMKQSSIFEGMQQPDSALFYAKKAREGMINNPELSPENFQKQTESSAISTLLGNAFTGKAAYDSALYYYHSGIPVAISGYMETDLINDYNGIAAVYKATGDLDSAVWYAQQALTRTISKAYPLGLLKATNMLASIYEVDNKPDSALKYVKLAIGLKDSLFNRQKTITIQNLTYKEQEKEREIAASKLKIQNRFKLYFSLAGALAILVIGGILLKNNRQKQLQRMRNSIADDLHDDIGSTLSSISIMNELAKEKSPDALPLLASIGENTLTLQENMSDIVWAVNPKNDHFENVLQRMNQFASEILEAKNIELSFSSDPSLSSSRLSMGQRKNFYLFFKEAINNAAKYSDAKKVSVSIAKKDHHINMSIRDDGKGFDAGRIFNGNGMATLRKRGTELNAHFNIDSHLTKGTIVQLKFKIT